MKTIDFGTLYHTDYQLANLFAMRQKWPDRYVFRMEKPRSTNALLWLNGCSAIYRCDGRDTVQQVPQGAIVYIPCGAVYETEFLSCGGQNCHTILIEFTLSLPDGETFAANPDIAVLMQMPVPDITALFHEMVEEFSSTILSFSELKGTLYKILSQCSGSLRRENIYSREYRSIANGILYMEANINQNLSIEEIAEMCHVSPSNFRRLFKKYAGMSPVEYRTYSKMEYAKKLLRSNTYRVAEIAEILQYDDPAYFCRVFKKVTGCTPGRFYQSCHGQN